jgi:hypothetical protein
MSEIDHAIKVVAREIVSKVSPDWEDYPEIGEHDWERIVAEVKKLTKATEPTLEEFTQAWVELSNRAEHGGTDA